LIDISIVIVNYNVQFFLRQCLNSIFKSSGGLNLEVIVVDNASTDGSVSMLNRDYPNVSLIANDKNLGFSVANNQALDLINGKYTLILNPDTLISEDTLANAFTYMEDNAEVGALGVKMLDGAGNFHKESKRAYPSVWASFCRMTGIYKLFPKSKMFNGYYQGHLPDDQLAETEVLCGAFMFIRTLVFKKLNGFDEAFFMYGEDIDLSYRIANAGYKLIYYPHSSIIHYKGESRSRVDSRYVKSFYGSMHIFLRKNSKGFFQKLFLPLFSILIAFKAGYTYLSSILKNLLGPIIDLLLLCLGQVIIKNAWEKYYFKDVSYFEEKNVLALIGIFSLIIVCFQFVSGKYDDKYSVKNLAIGFVISVLLIFLLYAILPAEYRFSRALVMGGSLISMFTLLGTLATRNYWSKGKFGLQVESSKGALLIGSQESANSLEVLSKGNHLGSKLIGFVSDNDADAIGTKNDIHELLAQIPIDEIVFSAKDIDYKFMQEQMVKLGSKYEYKILSEDSMSLLSSNFANKKGNIYTIQTGFNIDEAVNRRLKRAVDFFGSLLILLLSPLLLIFTKLKMGHVPALFSALLGQKTLVSYNDNNIDRSNFPSIKQGVFRLNSSFANIEQEELFCINFAKNHSLYLEIEQILKAII